MIKNILLVLIIITSYTFAQNPKVITLNQTFGESIKTFAKNRIVIKFSDQLLENIDRNLLQKGKVGDITIDLLCEKFDVKEIIEQFPKAKEKIYKGSPIKLRNWHKFIFNNEIDAELVVNEFKKISDFIDVQPVSIHSIIKSSNDPSRADQWHLDQTNDHDIDIEDAWDIETGNSDIVVAIFDTGVRYFHKDLGGSNTSYSNPGNSDGNMWLNIDDTDGNGVDDDGNGYDDDWIGWDFVTGVQSSPLYQHIAGEDYDDEDNDPRDFNGHGTHCAGIVGAINNNGYAVSSPAGGWNNGSQAPSSNGVRIMACRIGYSVNFLGLSEVGLVGMDFAAEAFYYAADNGAHIVSCSWGSSNSGGLGDALDYFIASGGLVFKAAGNDDDEGSDYMLDRSDVIGVASTDQDDVKSSFSTYGTFVDISAPGTDIMSTYHSHDDQENDYIATISGTSMATPLAASVASLIWSQNTSWTAPQVQQRLFDTADDIYGIPGNSSYIGKLGAGRINAHQALLSDGIMVDLKVMIEGAYASSSTMNSTLLTNNFIPTTSPYADARTVSSVPASVVDWVLVELRKTSDGVVEVSKSAFLRNDGMIVGDDGTSKISLDVQADDYFIVIKHRNHISIMSAAVVGLPNATTYDFTTGSDKYWGTDGAKQLE